MSVTYVSVCSGIEAATVAWHPLGWKPVGFSEIEPFPARLLAHHYPDTANYGDLTRYKEWPLPRGTRKRPAFDVLVGGTPCQSFSVAGLRGGLADPRGNLALTFLGCVARYRPRVVVWENVPGVLSSTSHVAPDPRPPKPPVDLERDGQEVESYDHYDSDEDHAFGCFLSGLSELGYEWSYRVLDAQHFGVPQRRRRVFVVASPRGSGVHPASILFEPESLQRDLTPSRETREGIAPSVAKCLGSSGGGVDREDKHTLIVHSLRGEGHDAGEDGTGRGTPLVAESVPALTKNYHADNASREELLVAHTVSAKWAKGTGGPSGDECQNLVAFSCKDSGEDAGSISPTLRSMNHDGSHANGEGQVAVAIPFDTTQVTNPDNRSQPKPGDPCHPLASGAHAPAVAFETRFVRNGRGAPSDVVPPLKAQSGETGKRDAAPCVAFSNCGGDTNLGISETGEAPPVTCSNGNAGNVATGSQVRRLTPRECERLQGFPDDYTLLPESAYEGYRNNRSEEDCEETVQWLLEAGWSEAFARAKANHPDGPRYKALGNSMAVPVMRWIGERIEQALNQ